ncbi:MAG: ADP-ribosylglycohydrolase family protein [Planctomycetota bacterium]
MADRSEQYIGSLLGLGLADALGAPYEGWSTESSPWKPMPMTRRGTLLYTDDTDMAIGSAESIVACGAFSVDHMALHWAKRAEPARGYGGGAIRCLENITRGMPWRDARFSIYKAGSYGNGAAMRVAPIALLFANDKDALDDAVRLASSVTHAHPIGIQGALIIAHAIAAALKTNDGEAIFAEVMEEPWDTTHEQRMNIAYGMLGEIPDHKEVASVLGNGIGAHESVTSALLIACSFIDRPFADMFGYIVSVGGDVDTIGAMAGSVWGAARGCSALPDPPLSFLEDMETLKYLALAIYQLAS